jgi:hypothetical protein
LAKVLKAKAKSIGEIIVNILSKIPVAKNLIRVGIELMPNKDEALPKIVEFSVNTLNIPPVPLLNLIMV